MNVVGSSPMSSPSRLIQTLQAALDTHPSNLNLVSATQTSLRFSWKVPKHTQACTIQTPDIGNPLTFIVPLYTHLICANLTGNSFVSLQTLFVYLLIFLHQC